MRAWAGRVAERAKQAPGMCSVGVRMGGWGEEGVKDGGREGGDET